MLWHIRRSGCIESVNLRLFTFFMKSDKKASIAKASAAAKKSADKKVSPKAKTVAAAEPVAEKKPSRSRTGKAVKKIAEVVGSALETTKKAATKIKEAAEKAEATVKQSVDTTAARVKATAEKAAAAVDAPKPKVPAKKKTLTIPSILLEGDRPAAPPPVSGPGQRYALGPTPPTEHFAEMEELPEAYGTRKLILTARDPHWLYAHWDFTRDQLNKYNALSADGHLVLRVYENEIASAPLTQVHVHPESRNWFVHVGRGGTRYVAELGYYNRAGRWMQVTSSGATITPPDALSEDTSVRFATIPVDVPFEELVRLVKAAIRENVPLAEAIQQLRAAGYTQLPATDDIAQFKWTPEQERALASLVSIDQVRRVWIGSLEITELVRRQLMQEMSSISAAQLQVPSSFSLASLSSPFGGAERRKGFWFNVNAELIIYGATEPDATVEIGGRKIKLRSDGTFSYRFILPDGNYDLPAVATSSDGDDSRSAALKFSRRTDYQGDVGKHPQDPNMKPPLVENVA